MSVFIVVPWKEIPAIHATMFDRAEAVWEIASVLHGLELRLGVWVVIGDVRP